MDSVKGETWSVVLKDEGLVSEERCCGQLCVAHTRAWGSRVPPSQLVLLMLCSSSLCFGSTKEAASGRRHVCALLNGYMLSGYRMTSHKASTLFQTPPRRRALEAHPPARVSSFGDARLLNDSPPLHIHSAFCLHTLHTHKRARKRRHTR